MMTRNIFSCKNKGKDKENKSCRSNTIGSVSKRKLADSSHPGAPKKRKQPTTMPGIPSVHRFRLFASSRVLQVAHEVDLCSQTSLEENFPIKSSCGNLSVPLQVCAFSTNLQETFTKIEQFRMMGIEDQEFEHEIKRRMKTGEKNFYLKRLKHLAAEQKHLQDKFETDVLNFNPTPLPAPNPSN